MAGENIATVDLDGDDRDELLMLARPTGGDWSELLLVAYDNGRLAQRWRAPAGLGRLEVVTHRDLDGDGAADVMVQHTSGDVGIHFNTGGRLQPIDWFSTATDFGTWQPLGMPVPYDRDGDGAVDSLTTTIVSPSSARGAWNFQRSGAQWKPTQGPTELVGCETFGESVYADFDGDGREDFVAREFGGVCDPYIPHYDPTWWRIYVFLSRPNQGEVEFAGSYPAGGTYRSGTYVVDVDQDGASDVLLTIPNGFSYLRNLGDGRFEDPVVHEVSGEGQWFILDDIGDFNGDGITDMLVRLPDGLASFTVGPQLPAPNYIDVDFDESGDIDVADLNGDGISDLLLEDPNSDNRPRDRTILLSRP